MMFVPTTITALAISVFAIASFDAVASLPTEDDNNKVQVELYFESQCPGCRETITESFKEAYDAKGFLDMADVSLIPFGNAKESGDDTPYSFSCQHGESECKYNLMETCSLSKISCPYAQFQFILCIESHDESREVDQDYDKVLETCSSSMGLSEDTSNCIKECYKGFEGNTLEHGMAEKTASLDPPHQYVPWIVANGEHDDKVQDEIMKSLLDYVCRTYKGSKKSPDCPSDDTSNYLRETDSKKVAQWRRTRKDDSKCFKE